MAITEERSMSRTLVAAVALFAAGCTTWDLDDVWSKPNASTLLISRDDWDCRHEVDESAPRTPDLIVGGVVDVGRVVVEERFRDATYAKCMTARGYTRTATTGNPLARMLR
jgi:hypothetical protein